jgi:hypothetical protein
MRGVVPTGQKPWETGALYSILGIEGRWSILRGSLARKAKDQVTQRVETVLLGTALEVVSALIGLGFTFPLYEQWEGDLDLPTPKDLYFEACCKRMPGRYLTEAGDYTRIGLSLTAARRKGWKLHFFEEPEEDALFSGGYLEALEKGEFPPLQVLGGWGGKEIGSRRHGVIRDGDLDEVLGLFDVDPAQVFGLGLENRDASTPTR